MVQLFDQIGLGQWFRYVTGAVEVAGALALIAPGLAWFGGLWLGGTMFFAALTHVFVLHTGPVPAIVLGVLNALIARLNMSKGRSVRLRGCTPSSSLCRVTPRSWSSAAGRGGIRPR